ncbi:MAG: hypothetical protein KW806_00595 [Candidatus Yanofskybacteria bacterium]|nr:hypothetical protein [Candidatus Yanofskybacteria bacterium]
MGLKHVKNWFASEERFLKTPIGIFLLGAFLGELSPDPTDAIHFWLQQHVLNNPAIPGSTRAIMQVFDWYFMSALWFLILLIFAYTLHIKRVSTIKRITLVGGIMAIGLAIGILAQVLVK